jgi:hypothetical protein
MNADYDDDEGGRVPQPLSDKQLERLHSHLKENLCFPAQVKLEVGVAFKLVEELLALRDWKIRATEADLSQEEWSEVLIMCEAADRMSDQEVSMPDGPVAPGKLTRLRAETPKRPINRAAIPSAGPSRLLRRLRSS